MQIQIWFDDKDVRKMTITGVVEGQVSEAGFLRISQKPKDGKVKEFGFPLKNILYWESAEEAIEGVENNER